jgi:hypothetical protein
MIIEFMDDDRGYVAWLADHPAATSTIVGDHHTRVPGVAQGDVRKDQRNPSPRT